jgi:hypothetical protein
MSLISPSLEGLISALSWLDLQDQMRHRVPLSLSSPWNPLGVHPWLYLPSNPPLSFVHGPVHPSCLRRKGSPSVSGQRCQPSQLQRVKMAAIRDFLDLEDTWGTREVIQEIGPTLQMCKVEFKHSVLGCQNCNLTSYPYIYCKESHYHPGHSLHLCPQSQYCGCLDA